MQIERRTKLLILPIVAMVMMVSCKSEKKESQMVEIDNILLKEWVGPYGGVPAFDKLKVEDVNNRLTTFAKKAKLDKH